VTPADRLRAVVASGFTERQASFLVKVMLHAGVFLRRQYCTHARIVRGQKAHDFLGVLTSRRFATVYRTAHRSAHIYHLHGKGLYRAIDEADNRHRRPVTLARAIERLMLLDAVLTTPDVTWLATEREKVEHFATVTSLRPEELPRLLFGAPPRQTIRYFPDKLPIGLAGDDKTHVFLYGVTSENPVDFRGFLHRHGELLRALRAWEIRLLVPSHVAAYAARFELAAREELGTPLRVDAVADLRWYFEQRKLVDAGRAAEDPARFEALRRTFTAQRYWALYRTWQREGDSPVYGTTSPVLEAAMANDEGRITRHALSHSYLHLVPVVGSA